MSERVVGKMPAFHLSQGVDGKRFLGFSLPGEINALIALGDLQGTREISIAELLPVPQMSDYLLGIINWRGKATWVVDLACLMGIGKGDVIESISAQQMGLLIQVGSETVALLVDRVSTISTYHPQDCLPIAERMFMPELCRFFKGYFLDENDRPWVLLDVAKTIDRIEN